MVMIGDAAHVHCGRALPGLEDDAAECIIMCLLPEIISYLIHPRVIVKGVGLGFCKSVQVFKNLVSASPRLSPNLNVRQQITPEPVPEPP